MVSKYVKCKSFDISGVGRMFKNKKEIFHLEWRGPASSAPTCFPRRPQPTWPAPEHHSELVADHIDNRVAPDEQITNANELNWVID